MKFRMPDPDLPADGFTNCDIFERKQLATSIISIAEHIEDNLVLLLDAPWGNGKTFFLKQFQNYASTQGYPCIYFDAFQNDIRQDAFAAITSEILTAVEANTKKPTTLTRDLSKKAGVVGKHLLKGIATATAQYATAGLVNAELISRITSDQNIADAIKAGTDELIENGLSSLTETIIREHQEAKTSISDLRIALNEAAEALVRAAASEESQNPQDRAFLIVDELDRCRPNFSLEILEVIKHIFNVDKITFLISADSAQVHESIRHCYGAGIDSERYLEKFFDIRLRFPESNERGKSVLENYAAYISSNLTDAKSDRHYVDNTLEQLVELANTHRLSVRSFQKICQNLALVLSQTQEGDFRAPPLIALLCFCREIAPSTYEKLIAQKIDYDTLLSELSLSQTNEDENENSWFFSWIRWALAEDLNNESTEVQGLSRHLFSYSLDRRRLIPLLAKRMVEPTSIVKAT